MKKNLLITGAGGQLGKAFQDQQNDYSNLNLHALSRSDLDITNHDQIAKAFDTHRFHACLNCAAYTAVDRAETQRNQAFAVNAGAPHLLAQFCRQNQVKLIHFSTDYVFGGTGNHPHSENDHVLPESYYGYTKRIGELNVLQGNPNHLVIRLSAVYDSISPNFLNAIIGQAQNGSVLRVVDDQVVCPTPAAEIVKSVLTIISNGKIEKMSGIYHLCCSGLVSWYDFAHAILETAQLQAEIEPISSSLFSAEAKRPSFALMACEKWIEQTELVLPHWRKALVNCLNENY